MSSYTPVLKMKLTLIVLLLCSVKTILSYTYTTKYIEVPVDHFSFSNNATFQLKYLINDTYWIDDGPIFFYTGNEGTIENFAENTGFMFDIAPTFNALLIFAEHRYYGTSLPFGNLSYTSPQYLGYLTSNQALADYVFLINFLQKSLSSGENSRKVPVVAFGGSYGGMLAAYLRMKYPSSVVGALASSAPIWQFEGLTPCENFNKIVTDVFKSANPGDDCSVPLKNAWSTIRKVAANDTGKSWISKEWKLCTPLKTEGDVDILVNWVVEILINMVMVNYPYPTSFLAPLPANPVRNFCSNLTGTSELADEKLLTAIGGALEIYTNYTHTTECNVINVTAEALGEVGWNFQACTEMIMPMCSKNDMFEDSPWDFQQFAEDCYKQFGVKQLMAEFPILEYGGKDIGAASNIVFSNGLLDPWSSGGVLRNISSTVVAVIIPESAHHLDLRGQNEYDPISIIEARKIHITHIQSWIRDFYMKFYNKSYEKAPFYDHIEYVHLYEEYRT